MSRLEAVDLHNMMLLTSIGLIGVCLFMLMCGCICANRSDKKRREQKQNLGNSQNLDFASPPPPYEEPPTYLTLSSLRVIKDI